MTTSDEYKREGACGCAESAWRRDRMASGDNLLKRWLNIGEGLAGNVEAPTVDQPWPLTGATRVHLRESLEPAARPITAPAVYWHGSVTDLATDLRALLSMKQQTDLANLLGSARFTNPMHLLGDPASFADGPESADSFERAGLPAVEAYAERRAAPVIATKAEPAEPPVNLTARVLSRVQAWLELTAKRLRHDDADNAELRIFAHQPGWDDDDTCCLEVRIEERIRLEEIEGRVEGVQ